MSKLLPRLIRCKEVMQMTGLTRGHIWHLMGEGKFPSTIKLTGKAVAWRLDEVEQWVEARIALASSTQRRGPGRPPKNPWLTTKPAA